MALALRHCQPCEGGMPPLSAAKIKSLLKELQQPWQVVDNQKLHHEFNFRDFDEAMFFVNEVAAVADGEGHHPDIFIYFKKVIIELWTHAIGGLSENDFILASKIESCT